MNEWMLVLPISDADEQMIVCTYISKDAGDRNGEKQATELGSRSNFHEILHVGR